MVRKIILYILLIIPFLSNAQTIEGSQYKEINGDEKIFLYEFITNKGQYTTTSTLIIDTVYDYSSLKSYAGNSKTVYVKKQGLQGLFKKTGTSQYVYGLKMNGFERIFEGIADIKWFGAIGDGSVHYLSEKYSNLTQFAQDYNGIGIDNSELNTRTLDEIAFWYGMSNTNLSYHYFNSAYIPAPASIFVSDGVYVFANPIKTKIVSLIGDNALITSSSNQDLFRIDESNGAFYAKFENIAFAFCKSVLNSWHSFQNPGIVNYFTFDNCYFEGIEYVAKYNLTPNAYLNFNNCLIEDANLFKGSGDFIGINGVQGAGKINIETPFICLGGKDIDENGVVNENKAYSILDITGLKVSPQINTSFPADSIYTFKRVWIYSTTASSIRVSHSRFGGEGAGMPLILIDSCTNGLYSTDINISSTTAYSTDRPPIILNGNISKIYITNDCTLSYIGQYGKSIYLKSLDKYITGNYGCTYPLGSETHYISFLDINIPDWYCSSDLLYLKKYLKNNNYLPSTFDWYVNNNAYINTPTNCTIDTTTNLGIKFNRVTATNYTALNYAVFNVLDLNLPNNQTVFCTIRFKGDCKNAFVQIITDINGKDKYEQIRLNNTKDGFSFIHFPVFSNLKTLRVLTEFDKIGQDFEFETPKFSYL